MRKIIPCDDLQNFTVQLNNHFDPSNMNCISQADKELITYINKKRDRKQNILMIVAVFTTMTGMIIMDFVSKWRNAENWKRKLEKEGSRKCDSTNKQSNHLNSSFPKQLH